MANAFRVLRHRETNPQGKQTEWFAIHEVYIGDSGVPQSCSKDPVVVVGDSILELAENLRGMLEALDGEPLEYDDLGP